MVNAILYIVFDCIAICDDFGKDISYWNVVATEK